MRGGPEKAQSITQTRPFSRMCAAVSAPLPMWSSYSIVRPSTIESDSIGPFGETLTCPPSLGAVRDEEERLPRIQAASAVVDAPRRASP